MTAYNDTNEATWSAKYYLEAVRQNYVLLFHMGPRYYSEEIDSGSPVHENCIL